MQLWQNILLFLPLALGICIVASSLQQETVADIVKKGARFFVRLIVCVIVISAAITILMEWVLAL